MASDRARRNHNHPRTGVVEALSSICPAGYRSGVPDQRIDLIIIQKIPNCERLEIGLRQNIPRPVEGRSIGHVRAGHRTSRLVGHVSARAMRRKTIVEYDRSGRTRAANRRDITPLRIVLEKATDILVNAGILPSRRLLGTGNIIETAIGFGRIIKRHPKRD